MKPLIIIILALALVTAGTVDAQAAGVLKGTAIFAVLPFIALLIVMPFIAAYTVLKGKSKEDQPAQQQKQTETK